MRGIWSLFLFAGVAALACAPQVEAPAPQGTDVPPKAGGVLNSREPIYFTNLDPTAALRAEVAQVTTRAFDALLRFKWGPDVGYDDLIIGPHLAERWEASADARTFTFHLRKGVKFADLPPVNGRELTAEDVKWSFEYIARLGPFKDLRLPTVNQLAALVEGLERVETPDRYTAVVHFKEPFVPFLTYAATPQMAMMPREVFDEDGNFNQRPIGTGPWQWDAAGSQAGTRMVYKKNPSYWQTGKPYLDEVRTLVIPDDGSYKAAFQTRQIDIYRNAEFRDGEELQAKVPDAKFVKWLGWNSLRIWYNVNVPPLNDVKFRRALNLAVDREEFVRTFTGGQGAWSMGGTVPGIFTQEEIKKLVPYNPDEARRLLREGGYTAPVELEYLYSTGYGEELLSESQLLQAQLKKVGIELKIVTIERLDAANRRRNGNYVMSAISTGAAVLPEADTYVHSYFHPRSAANFYHVNDPTLTAFTEAQRRETDPAKRRELWRQQAKYIVDNGYALWIYHAPNFDLWHPYVKNYHPNTGIRNHAMPDTWLDK